jgi:hypothetical protein
MASVRALVTDVPARVGQRGVEVGRPVLQAVAAGDLLELAGVAADEHRFELHPGAVGQQHAAVLPDREHRADEVLPVAHASRDAVHDDAEGAGGQRVLLCSPSCSRRCGKRLPGTVHQDAARAQPRGRRSRAEPGAPSAERS